MGAGSRQPSGGSGAPCVAPVMARYGIRRTPSTAGSRPPRAPKEGGESAGLCTRRARCLPGAFDERGHALHLVSGDATKICDTQALDGMGRKLFRRTHPLCDITGGWAALPPEGRTRLCVCEPHVDRGRLSPACHEQPCGASVASPLPLLAQEVLQLVHELFRVKVVLTPGARRFITRRGVCLSKGGRPGDDITPR